LQRKTEIIHGFKKKKDLKNVSVCVKKISWVW